jgi:hypothetical protein
MDLAGRPLDGRSPDVTVIGDVIDICRLAARRTERDEISVEVIGDAALGERVLASVGAFSRD